MKIYALFMTYEQMDWLPWTVDQMDRALKFGSVDKVLITEGGHSKKVPVRSTDKSWEYLNDRIGSDSNYVLFDAKQFRDTSSVYGNVQAAILNNMCKTIPLDEETWLFYIHDDEYFFDSFLKSLKDLCVVASSEDKDMIVTRQMAFTFNMKLYWLNRTCYMLFNWKEGTHWAPITTPCYLDGASYLGKPDKIKFDKEFEHITFHFSHVKKPKRQKYRHLILPAEMGYNKAALWHKEIYEKADLNNLEEIYEKNRSILGYGFKIDSPDMGPAKIQKLNVYKGEYPEVIKNHPYMDIEDIRKI